MKVLLSITAVILVIIFLIIKIKPSFLINAKIYKTGDAAHAYFKNLDIAGGKKAAGCDKPLIIGRQLSKKELEDVTILCSLVADVFTNMSRKNANRTLDLNYAEMVINNSSEFTAFDPDLAYIPSIKGQTSIKGSKNWMKVWEEGFKDIEILDKLSINDLNIIINGSMALTTFTDKVAFKMKNGEFQTGGRNNTLIWIYKNAVNDKNNSMQSNRQKEGWYIIHEHASHGN